MDPLRHVKFYATVKHAGQLYAGLPYTHHLAAVETVLRRFGFTRDHIDPSDMDVLEAAWLHDIVEDTGTKVKELEELFGPRVAELVHAVTNEPDGSAPYARIRSVYGAVALKLADRIANVEHGLNGGRVLKKYHDKHEDFRRALYTPGENEEMWKHLNGLMAQP